MKPDLQLLVVSGMKRIDFAEFLVQKNKPKQRYVDLDIRDLKGILKTNKVVSIEDMNAAIIDGAIGGFK